MSLAGRRLIAAFMHEHADTRTALSVWIKGVREASWHSPAALRERYPGVSFVKEGVVVFRVKGNACRIAARIDYANGVVRVVAVGTHAGYDRRRL